MPILISNIKVPLGGTNQDAIAQAIHRLRISPSQVAQAFLYKKSLDARKPKRICFVSSVLLFLRQDEQQFCSRLSNPSVVFKQQPDLVFPHGTAPLRTPIYIIGFGSAGLFCAYTLAKHGYRPIVVERGYDVDQRAIAVNRFWEQGTLNTCCNVQFGEGGAGTFSDGKLTTRISDSRCRYVLSILKEFGAPEEILYQAKPHIGTDYLRNIIKRIRQEIIDLGGQVRFEQLLEKIHVKDEKLSGLTINGIYHKTEYGVLAIGHSARDTFSMLLEAGVPMQSKDFSVGVRIEHLQQDIDQALYGDAAGHPSLPTGEYQLSYREGDRAVYTFCMCPGGLVVPSSSEQDTIVTNGMSYHSRAEKNANSALVVSVSPRDFGTGILGGMMFQQQLEERAFSLGKGNYCAPMTTAGAFLSNSSHLGLGRVEPSYALGVTDCDIAQLFPEEISAMLQKGLVHFDQKIPGFAAPDSVLTGVETRTSSPVRILRNEGLMSTKIQGIYPCGEGAGYAGGIMSAAVDGIRVAQALIKGHAPY